jgi:hypothetical protein
MQLVLRVPPLLSPSPGTILRLRLSLLREILAVALQHLQTALASPMPMETPWIKRLLI